MSEYVGFIDDLMTSIDIARRLGVTKQCIHQRRHRRGFPQPIVRIGRTFVWRASDIDAWIERNESWLRSRG